MKNKRTTYILVALVIVLSGTFISVKVNQYRQRATFTQEKWFRAPDKRFIIVKDMIKKYNFAGMTREQVTSLLGKPDDAYGTGGVPIRTYDQNNPVDLLDNPDSICYFTKTGRMAEDFNGFYLRFDKSGKVIDFAIVHFTT